MYQQEQKLENMHQSSSFIYQHLKKLIQVAVSFSMFSLAADKKYIFLLCNGILVFIAKNSGDTRPPRGSIQTDFMSVEKADLVEDIDEVMEEEGHDVEDEEDEIQDQQEQEAVAAAAIAKLSTEELNRKFEDFIRKMKEDLRFEARQQLIVV
ncbi:Cell division protein ZipA [Bienertia sinuspersici]